MHSTEGDATYLVARQLLEGGKLCPNRLGDGVLVTMREQMGRWVTSRKTQNDYNMLPMMRILQLLCVLCAVPCLTRVVATLPAKAPDAPAQHTTCFCRPTGTIQAGTITSQGKLLPSPKQYRYRRLALILRTAAGLQPQHWTKNCTGHSHHLLAHNRTERHKISFSSLHRSTLGTAAMLYSCTRSTTSYSCMHTIW